MQLPSNDHLLQVQANVERMDEREAVGDELMDDSYFLTATGRRKKNSAKQAAVPQWAMAVMEATRSVAKSKTKANPKRKKAPAKAKTKGKGKATKTAAAAQRKSKGSSRYITSAVQSRPVPSRASMCSNLYYS